MYKTHGPHKRIRYELRHDVLEQELPDRLNKAVLVSDVPLRIGMHIPLLDEEGKPAQLYHISGIFLNECRPEISDYVMLVHPSRKRAKIPDFEDGDIAALLGDVP